jgi:hypothetical protein
MVGIGADSHCWVTLDNHHSCALVLILSVKWESPHLQQGRILPGLGRCTSPLCLASGQEQGRSEQEAQDALREAGGLPVWPLSLAVPSGRTGLYRAA